ncbi:MEKHLA domain-containing protein [Kineosporia sp. NBRC 101731]|nr:MEKHLA domain-containing protein [Kineosporia sp. NBRC 101731]
MGPRDQEFADLLLSSHLTTIGRPLAPEGVTGEQLSDWFYTAPFGLLAHEFSADPVFVYANLQAQKLFGYDWDEFTGLPSRLSAGPQDRAARDALLKEVAENGYTDDYRGLRVTRSGRPFWIERVTVWNLTGTNGKAYGQAALIRRWQDA